MGYQFVLEAYNDFKVNIPAPVTLDGIIKELELNNVSKTDPILMRPSLQFLREQIKIRFDKKSHKKIN